MTAWAETVEASVIRPGSTVSTGQSSATWSPWRANGFICTATTDRCRRRAAVGFAVTTRYGLLGASLIKPGGMGRRRLYRVRRVAARQPRRLPRAGSAPGLRNTRRLNSGGGGGGPRLRRLVAVAAVPRSSCGICGGALEIGGGFSVSGSPRERSAAPRGIAPVGSPYPGDMMVVRPTPARAARGASVDRAMRFVHSIQKLAMA